MWAVFDVASDVRDLAIGAGYKHRSAIMPMGTDGRG